MNDAIDFPYSAQRDDLIQKLIHGFLCFSEPRARLARWGSNFGEMPSLSWQGHG